MGERGLGVGVLAQLRISLWENSNPYTGDMEEQWTIFLKFPAKNKLPHYL